MFLACGGPKFQSWWSYQPLKKSGIRNRDRLVPLLRDRQRSCCFRGVTRVKTSSPFWNTVTIIVDAHDDKLESEALPWSGRKCVY